MEPIYANRIKGTSADRIIEAAGITKVTFYRLFRTKTELERSALTAAPADTVVFGALRNIAGFIGATSRRGRPLPVVRGRRDAGLGVETEPGGLDGFVTEDLQEDVEWVQVRRARSLPCGVHDG